MFSFIKKSLFRAAFGLFLFFIYILIGTLWTGAVFGSVTFEQMIFNLTQPLKGVDTGIIRNMILWVFVFGFAAAFVLWRPWIVLSRFRRLRKFSASVRNNPRGYRLLLMSCTAVAAIATAFIRLKVYDWYAGMVQVGDIYEKNYKIPEKFAFDGKKRNLILIFGESMEKIYADEKVFNENLLPRLTELGNKYDTFLGFKPALGTTWTIAGITTTLCGTPMKLVMGNEMNYFSDFMPNMVCFPQVLKKHGYRNYYLQGSSLSFSGFSNMLRQHGFDEYAGREELLSEDPSREKDITNWGISDEELFNIARDKLKKISKDGKPFVLAMATIDTHPPSGYLNRSCPKRHGDLRDMYSCTDQLMGEFIDWVKRQDFYKDTVIVVVGDHLLMRNSLYDEFLYKQNHRELLNLFINSAVTASVKDRPFSTLDFAATILEAMGIRLPDHRYGLGVSLYSGAPTLAESYGDSLDSELAKRSEVYEKFFNKSSVLDADFSQEKYFDYRPGTKLCFYHDEKCGNAMKYAVVGTFFPSKKDVTWTHARDIEFKLNVGKRPDTDLLLKVKVDVFMTEEKNKRKTRILVNGHRIGTWKYSYGDGQPFFREVVIPKEDVDDNGNIYLVFETKGIGSLKKLGIADEDYGLYLGFKEMGITEM